jgi:hypothetical protein
MDSAQLFELMLTAMVGDEELADLLNWNMDEGFHNPDDWGLDDDDMHQARTDYASEILF